MVIMYLGFGHAKSREASALGDASLLFLLAAPRCRGILTSRSRPFVGEPTMIDLS